MTRTTLRARTSSGRSTPSSLWLLSLACLGAVACGGRVVFDGQPEPPEGGAGGSAGHDPGGAGGVGPGGGGGSGGQGATGGAGGAGGSCQRTYDGFAYTITSSGSSGGLDCATAQPGSSTYQHLDGVVVSTWPEGFSLDTCPPNMDCGFSLVYDVWISAPGLSYFVFEGQLVQLDVMVDFPWGCSQTLMVRNLPEWNGLASPAGSAPTLVVAGSDGAPTTVGDAPFGVFPVALGCVGVDQGCGIEDDYRLDFQTLDGFEPIYQGETRELALPSGPNAVQWGLARNLRSFETGWCDDYWNWAYWVVPTYLD
jgi:hypothetical protein